jgi:hypothetical protein
MPKQRYTIRATFKPAPKGHEAQQPQTIERAHIWHRDEVGKVHYLASLCGIKDASPSYRRVIRAELATECADELTAIIEGGE